MRSLRNFGKKYTAILCAAVFMSAIAQPSRAGDTAEKGQPAEGRTVAILVFNGMDIQDFAGPADVFSYAGIIQGTAAFRQFAVAKSLDPITSQGFVKIVPNYTFADCPKPDILVIPGGNVSGVVRDEETMNWIKAIGNESDHVLSVCTGALVLQSAGFLDGIKATTHWGSITKLRESAPSTTVVENVRYVDNGKVITSAGVSAGLDMSLHVVAKLLGFDLAKQTATRMEYEWKPREDYPKQ